MQTLANPEWPKDIIGKGRKTCSGRIRKKLHPCIATTLNNMAVFFTDIHQYKKAEAFFFGSSNTFKRENWEKRNQLCNYA